MLSKAKFILSKSKVLEQYEKIKEISNQVSYSLKTNFEVGKVLEENCDCQFSVHSLGSANLIKDKKRVLFFAQGLGEDELLQLYTDNLNSFVVDNGVDLDRLLRFTEEKEWHVNIFLRMRLKEHTIHTGKHFVFGFYSEQINNLIPKLRLNKRVLNLGIHFHRKTQNLGEWNLKDELEEALSKEVLGKITFVNIGGGIPAEYKNYRPEVLEGIFEKINELKNWLNFQIIKMIVEPGRFIAAPSVKLETKIMAVYKDTIIVNASVYNGIMDTFVAHIRLLVENEKDSGKSFTIKGSTPDSMDIIRYRVFLEKDPKIGDKIIFLNAGAYNYSTDFCKLPKLDTEIID